MLITSKQKNLTLNLSIYKVKRVLSLDLLMQQSITHGSYQTKFKNNNTISKLVSVIFNNFH